MLIYAAVMLTLMLSSLIVRGDARRRRVFHFWIASLILFVGLRYQVGCDWSGYLFHYQRALNSSFDELVGTHEPGHWTIVWLIAHAGLPYSFVNIAMALIFFAGFRTLSLRFKDPLQILALAFPILILNMPMSGIRQGAAVGLICFAFVSVIDRKLVPFFLWVFVAGLIHQSAWIFALAAPLVIGKINLRTAPLALFLSIPGALFLFRTDVADSAIAQYAAQEITSAGAPFRVAIVLLPGIFYLFVMRKRWAQQGQPESRLLFWSSLASFMPVLILPISSVIADRVAYYIMPISLIILSYFGTAFKSRDKWLLQLVPFVAMALAFFAWALVGSHFNLCYVPYQIGISPAPTL